MSSNKKGSSAAAAAVPMVDYKLRDRVWASWLDGTKHEAELIEERSSKKQSSSSSSSSSFSSSSSSSSSSSEKEFYVHYVNYNRRLDEWVTVDRLRGKIDSNDGVEEEAGASGTAGVKRQRLGRKQDEVGHESVRTCPQS